MISVLRVYIVYMAIWSASAMYVTIRLMGFSGKYHKKSNESVYVTSFISAILYFPPPPFAPLFPRLAPSLISPHTILFPMFSPLIVLSFFLSSPIFLSSFSPLLPQYVFSFHHFFPVPMFFLPFLFSGALCEKQCRGVRRWKQAGRTRLGGKKTAGGGDSVWWEKDRWRERWVENKEKGEKVKVKSTRENLSST